MRKNQKKEQADDEKEEEKISKEPLAQSSFSLTITALRNAIKSKITRIQHEQSFLRGAIKVRLEGMQMERQVSNQEPDTVICDGISFSMVSHEKGWEWVC